MHSTKTLNFDLVAAAHADMIDNGFQPDFPPGTDTELAKIKAQAGLPDVPGAQDLRNLLWSSIDNDTSKDLDQIEWAEQLPDGRIRVLIGVADVDIRVPRGSLLDKHAQSETTSVYTGVKVFPMLPADLPAIVGVVAYRHGVYDIRKADTAAVRHHFIGCNPKRAKAKGMVVRQCYAMGWKVTDDNEADALAIWSFMCSLLDPSLALAPTALFGRTA